MGLERILIAEDCAVLASSLARLLGRRFAIDITASATEAEAMIERGDWSGALFDFTLVDGVATNAMAAFRKRVSEAPMVVISGGSSNEVSAIAAEHEAYFVSKPLRNFDWLDLFRRRSVRPRPAPVLTMREALEARSCTPREAQVVDLYCADKTADEVAVALGISTPTVRSHLTRACERLGVKSVKALQYELLHQLGALRREP